MIWQMIEDWFRGILTDGILSNLSGLFDSVNTEVGEIATQVGTTPAGWNAGIFNMIRSLSENVIVPIAGVIITFVMCYELIQLVIEKNNLHDLDTWIFFKWIFKTFVAVLLVTNTWNIVMGVFDVTQSVVNQSAGVTRLLCLLSTPYPHRKAVFVARSFDFGRKKRLQPPCAAISRFLIL